MLHPLVALFGRVVRHALLIAALLVASPSFAAQQNASVGGEVKAGKYYAVRLNGLSEGDNLNVEVEVKGPLVVLMVEGAMIKRWPDVGAPIFRGAAQDKLSFSVRIEKTGTHFIVLDNRRNDIDRTFDVKVRAQSGKDRGDPPPKNDAAPAIRSERKVEQLIEQLQRYFVFDSVRVERVSCGSANAYTDNDRIIICDELEPFLRRYTSSDKEAADVAAYTILHELSHVMLRQWGYPFYDNEEIADEFAFVMLDMFGQRERAGSVADLLLRLSPEREFEAKLKQFDRHPLSVQRARSLRRWLGDEQISRRWQPIVVPHLQTAALETLKRSPRPWTDIWLVEKELASRRS